MKYNLLYPEAQVGFEKDCIIKCAIGAPSSCVICDEDTEWADINFEVMVCSEECRDKLESDYSKACALARERNDDGT